MGRRKLTTKTKSKGDGPQKKKQKIGIVEQSSSSSSSSSSDVEKSEPRDKAFSIDLIWRKLAQCLNYHDLKTLRLVSNQFNNAVLNQTNFINRTVVTLLDFGRLTPSEFGTTGILWKHFKIRQFADKTSSGPKEKKNKKNKKDKFGWFYRLLQSAESIEVSTLAHYPDSPAIHKILQAPAPNTLKKLVIHTNLLLSSVTQKNLLKLSDSAKNNLQGVHDFHVSAIIPVNGYDYKNEFIHHLIKSIDLLRPHLINLRKIGIENIHEHYTYDMSNIVDAFLFNDWIFLMHDGLVKIIEQNQNSLVELHAVDMHTWLQMEDASSSFSALKKTPFKSVFDMTFPHLKSLSMKTLKQEKPIINFLKNQPELEQLNLKILHQFPLSILETIEQKGQKLKRLHISTKGFNEKKDGMWKFLEKLENLEDFGMDLVGSNEFSQNVEPAKILLSCLPRSIKKLYLKGFEYENLIEVLNAESDDDNDHLDCHILTGPDFERINAKQLTNLTLRSMNYGVCVNSDTMEFICNNFTMLQHLDIFGSGDQVTDFASSEDLSLEFFIQNLKGLRSLVVNCVDLPNKTYVNSIKFRELEHLEISVGHLSKKSVTSETIPTILKENPSLRSFVLFGKSIKLPEIEEMKKLNSRIQTVQVKSISENYDLDEDASDYDGENRSDDDDASNSDGSNSEIDAAGDSSNSETQSNSSEDDESDNSSNDE